MRSRGQVGSNRGHEQAEVRKDESADRVIRAIKVSHEELKEHDALAKFLAHDISLRQTREAGGPCGILGFSHVRCDLSRFFCRSQPHHVRCQIYEELEMYYQ